MKLRKLANLPNRDGFVFIGVLHDGRRIRCVVIKGNDGERRVYSPPGRSVFPMLAGWEKA